MSGFNSSSRRDYSSLEEDDLSLDLDDDDTNKYSTNILDTNKNKKNELKNINEEDEDEDDQFLFKIPDPLPLSEKLKLNKTKPTTNLDENLNLIDNSSKNLEVTLDNIFGSEDLEDDEDFLIRTQPMFSSTQMDNNKLSTQIQSFDTEPEPDQFKMTQISNKKDQSIQLIEKSIQINRNPLQINNNNSPGLNRTRASLENTSVIINTQSINELICKKSPADVPVDKNDTILTSIEANNENNFNDTFVWDYAQNDLNKKFKSLGIDSALLKRFSIDYYFKRFFDYSLLRIAEAGLRRLPFLCVRIKEINRNDRNSNATVVLTDGVDQMKGTISKQITINNWDQLGIGSVLVLQNVCLLRVNLTKNGYHLNINKPNLLRLYYKKSENTIDKIDFNEVRADNLKDCIHYFEKTYVFIDHTLIPINNSNLNITANSSVTNNKSINNQNNRAAPYQVPQQFSKNNSYNKNTNNNNNSYNKKDSSNSYYNQNISISNNFSNKNNNSNYQKSFNQQNQNQNDNRNFKFANNTTKNSQSINKTALSKSPINNKSQNIELISSSQKEISPDEFSQLIFGIEDELLKDDDY